MNLFAENLWLFVYSLIDVIFLPNKPCYFSNLTCARPVLVPFMKSFMLVFVAFGQRHIPGSQGQSKVSYEEK